MFMEFDERAVVMEPPPHASARAGTSQALTARLPVREFWWTPSPWDPVQEEGALALLYPLDRFAEGALEIGMLIAVVALFLAVLA